MCRSAFVFCFPVCMSVYRPEEVVRLSGAGITDGWELQCGFWEPNLGSQQEQSVHLTGEPSLQAWW